VFVDGPRLTGTMFSHALVARTVTRGGGSGALGIVQGNGLGLGVAGQQAICLWHFKGLWWGDSTDELGAVEGGCGAGAGGGGR